MSSQLPSLQDLESPEVAKSFYLTYYRLVADAARRVGFPLNLSPDQSSPDDALAFSLMCEALATYDSGRVGRGGAGVQFSSYLFKTVQFALARESDRRGKGIVSLEDEWGSGGDDIDPQEHLEARELRAAVNRALRSLPAYLRERVMGAVRNNDQKDPIAAIGLAAIRAYLVAEGLW